MAIDKVGSVAGAATSPALAGGQERFSSLLQTGRSAGPPVAPEGGLPSVSPTSIRAAPGAQQAQAPGCAAPGRVEAQALQPRARAEAAQWVDRVSQAQRRLDHILHLAESGRSFSPVELLSFQAQVYRASQELDLAGKVVEKATGGVKQVLQTQL